MGSIFKDMDLYKGIILASVLVLPAGGAVVYWLQQRVQEAEAAVDNATRTNGPLERIGLVYKQLGNLESSQGRTGSLASADPSRYFEQQLSGNIQGLGSTDYTLKVRDEGQGKEQAIDTEVEVEFKRNAKEEFPLSQEVVNVILYNCEAQSQGVWKLRSLRMVNEEAREALKKRESPPTTVADAWLVEDLVFARRRPDPNARGSGGKVKVK